MLPALTLTPPISSDAAEIVMQVVIRGAFGAGCAMLAANRGRSAVGWFIFGFLLVCIPLILVIVLPNLKFEEEKQRRHREETRRLREQLKKERQVADERHDASLQRLAVHDRALGLDTSTPQLPPAGTAPPPLPAAPNPTAPAAWYYAVDGVQHGPVPATELRDLWLDQRVPDSTIAWTEGMKDWRPIGEVGDLLGDAHA